MHNAMKISASIMAHPSRTEYISSLREKLGDVQVAYDKGRGMWKTCKAAWKMYDREADFHVVIQDDAIVCDDFYERAKKILEVDYAAYSFYFSNSPALVSMASKGMRAGYVLRPKLHWGVAVCLRTSLIEEMIEYCDKLNDWQDDVRIKKFLEMMHLPVYCPLPSLVSHRADSKSLVDNVVGREAMHFIDTV